MYEPIPMPQLTDPERETIIGAQQAEPQPLTDAQVVAATQEAFHPEGTRDVVTVGDREVQVRMLPWGVEQKMLDCIAPYLRLLVDATAVSQFDEMLQALLVEARHDLNKLAVIILANQWKAEPGFLADEVGTTEQKVNAWLAENAYFQQIADLVLAQVRKNKVADSLGKLWLPNVLHVRMLKVLDTLPSQLRQALQSKSPESLSALESTL